MEIAVGKITTAMIGRGATITKEGGVENWSDNLLDILEELYSLETEVFKEMEEINANN